MKVHGSALEHGISSEDAIQAAEWSVWIETLGEDGPPHRELQKVGQPGGEAVHPGDSTPLTRIVCVHVQESPRPSKASSGSVTVAWVAPSGAG